MSKEPSPAGVAPPASAFLGGVLHTGVGLLLFHLLVLVSTAAVARALGPAGQGRFQVVLSVSVALATLAKLGLDESAAYVLPRIARRTPERVRGAVLYVLAAPILLGVLFALAVHASGELWVRYVFRVEGLEQDLVLLAPLTAATLLLLTGLGVLRALGRPDLRSWIYYYAVAPVLTVVLVVMSAEGWAKVETVSLARAAIFAAGGVVAVAMVLRRLPRGSWRPPLRELRSLHRLGLFVTLGGFLQTLVEQPLVDLALVSATAAAEEVGTYAVASRAAALLALVPAAFVLVAGPSFARDVAGGDPERVRRLYLTSSRWMTRGALFLGGLMVVYRKDVLRVFGEEYVAGAEVLAVLALGYAVAGAAGPNGPIILAVGRERLDLVMVAFFAVTMVVLGVWFGSLWGPLGVAVASAVSTAGLSLGRRAVVHFVVGFRGTNPLPPLIAGAAAAAAAWWSRGTLPAFPVAAAAVSLTAYLALFAAVLWAAERAVRRLGKTAT